MYYMINRLHYRLMYVHGYILNITYILMIPFVQIPDVRHHSIKFNQTGTMKVRKDRKTINI